MQQQSRIGVGKLKDCQKVLSTSGLLTKTRPKACGSGYSGGT